MLLTTVWMFCLIHQACNLASFLAVSSLSRTSWVQLFLLPCCLEDACCNSHLHVIISWRQRFHCGNHWRKCLAQQNSHILAKAWACSPYMNHISVTRHRSRMPVFGQAGKSKVAQFKSVRIYFWSIGVWFTFFNSTVCGGCIALLNSVTFGVGSDRQK